MNSKTVKKLTERPNASSAVNRIAAPLRSLVDWSRSQQCYDDLFLAKNSITTTPRQLPFDIAPLLDAEIIVEHEKTGKISSTVMLHNDPHEHLVPELGKVKGIYVATDWPDVPPRETALSDGRELFDGREMVFPLHYESFAVLRELVRLIESGRSFRNCIDMFSGSGVIGIYAQKLGVPSVTFADVVPRAIAFSKLNAAMSGLESTTFIKTDCFKGVQSTSQYDLILANPPFEPVLDDERDKYYYHSYGGPSGQELMLRSAFRNDSAYVGGRLRNSRGFPAFGKHKNGNRGPPGINS